MTPSVCMNSIFDESATWRINYTQPSHGSLEFFISFVLLEFSFASGALCLRSVCIGLRNAVYFSFKLKGRSHTDEGTKLKDWGDYQGPFSKPWKQRSCVEQNKQSRMEGKFMALSHCSPDLCFWKGKTTKSPRWRWQAQTMWKVK